MTGNRRVAIVVATFVVVIVSFVLVKSNSGEKATRSNGHAYIRVVNGKPQGGVRTLTYKTGERVHFTVTSDVADEVHVHGFDRHQDVPKNGSVTFSFPASYPGDYEVELESRSEQIAKLQVR
jgi:heme/copper-type cytochrome/quinol oxidase subunit 2